MTDYEKAKLAGLTQVKRWEEDIPHHPMSERIFEFIREYDIKDNNDCYCWKAGGDGDNGEDLMYALDVFFETQDLES